MFDLKVLERVIAVLGEVPEGGEELDIRVSVALGQLQSGSAKLLRLFVEEGYDWSVISSLLDEQVPAYTTSLDVGVSGENIVGTLYSRKRKRWAAIHRGPDGREEGPVWAATEALARRAAGLAGILAQERMGRDQQVRRQPPDKPPRELSDDPESAGDLGPGGGEELPDWKILF